MLNKYEKKYIEKIIKKVGKAVNRYGLICENDRIAVAMSGGKDSFLMLESLVLRKKTIPVDYSLFAVHVNITNIPYEADMETLTSFCNDLNVPFYCINTEAHLNIGQNISPCFVCSRKRRIELFKKAGELKCNRLALGHHMDDAIETLFLNMTFNGSISSMPPRLPVFNGKIDIIRPLILLQNREIEQYAALKRFPAQKKECPHGNETRRSDIKKIISQLEGLNKTAKETIFSSMSNIHSDYLPGE